MVEDFHIFLFEKFITDSNSRYLFEILKRKSMYNAVIL